MADAPNPQNPDKPSDPLSTVPRRRQPPIDRTKTSGNSALEDQVSRLADRVSSLTDRLVGEEEASSGSAASAASVPLRERRFSRTGTVNGEESLNDLLQGGKVAATTHTPEVPSEQAGEETGAAPAKPAPRASTATAVRSASKSAAAHRRQLKLVIVASQILGFSLLLIGFGMGWLFFSNPDASRGQSSANPAPVAREPKNVVDPLAALGASDESLKAVDAALKAERSNDFPVAATLYEAMRRDEVNAPGLNYQAAIAAVRRGDLVEADLRLTSSINNGENIGACYYIRATFAGSKGDYATASRTFQAAARAEPFSSRPFFFWAECLRRDGHPLSAVDRFDEALQRPCLPADGDYIQFKRNLARVESANDPKFLAEVASKAADPNASGDSLLLAAALELSQSALAPAAAAHLKRASTAPGMTPSEFALKLSDYAFQSHSRRAEVAGILQAAREKRAADEPKPVPPATRAPFTDPAIQGIQDADPGNWPSPTISIAS